MLLSKKSLFLTLFLSLFFNFIKPYYLVFESQEEINLDSLQSNFKGKSLSFSSYAKFYQNALCPYTYPTSSVNKELFSNQKLKKSLYNTEQTEKQTEELFIQNKIKKLNPNLNIIYIPDILFEVAFILSNFSNYNDEQNSFVFPKSVRKIIDIYARNENVENFDDYNGTELFCNFKEKRNYIEEILGKIYKSSFKINLNFLDDLNNIDNIVDQFNLINNHPFVVYGNFHINNLIINIWNTNSQLSLPEIYDFLFNSLINLFSNFLETPKSFYNHLRAYYNLENNIYKNENDIFGFDSSPKNKVAFFPEIKNNLLNGSLSLNFFNMGSFKSFFNLSNSDFCFWEDEFFLKNYDKLKSDFFNKTSDTFKSIFIEELENHFNNNDYSLYRLSSLQDGSEEIFLPDRSMLRTVSFSNNLFAGIIPDPNASTSSLFFRCLSEDNSNSSLYFVKTKKTLFNDAKNIFYVAPINIFASFFSSGEWFHSRLKLPSKNMSSLFHNKNNNLLNKFISGLHDFILTNKSDYVTIKENLEILENNPLLNTEEKRLLTEKLIFFQDENSIYETLSQKNILFGNFDYKCLMKKIRNILEHKTILY